MGNIPKNAARDTFNLNIADAKMLVELAKLLSNRVPVVCVLNSVSASDTR